MDLSLLIFLLLVLSVPVVTLTSSLSSLEDQHCIAILPFPPFSVFLSISLQFFYYSPQPQRRREEREGPAADFVPSKCYFISFISASFYPQRRGRMLVRGRWWKRFDRQAKLLAIPIPPGPFPLGYHEICSAIIPALMHYCLTSAHSLQVFSLM